MNKKEQRRLFEAGASKKRLVDPKAKNPFVEKFRKKQKKTKWIHVAKVGNKLYVSGKLTDTIKELDGYAIVDFKVKGVDSVWLQLKKEML